MPDKPLHETVIAANLVGTGGREKSLLESLLEEEQLEKRQKKLDEVALEKRNREIRLAELQKANKERDAMQASCIHINETGRASTKGQKDHRGVYHLICTRCMKEFDGLDELPPLVAARMDFSQVGGPG